MDDKRGSINIDVSILLNWLETHYNVYAQDVITIDSVDHHLLMSISMKGNFIVSLGTDTLYNGDDIAKALKIFNLKVGGIKKTWKTISPENRNTVTHPTMDPQKS